MNANYGEPRYTIKELKQQNESIKYKVILDIFTSVLELSLLMGCIYGFLMLFVESNLI